MGSSGRATPTGTNVQPGTILASVSYRAATDSAFSTSSATLADINSRSVTDGVLNSTTTITSATASFAAGDVGKLVTGTGIPLNTVIASVTNSTTAVLSQAATATATGVSLAIQIGASFTAPPSGQVIVRAGCFATSSNNWHLSVREATTNVAQGIVGNGGSAAIGAGGSIEFLITGLTPGSTHTYKPGFSTDSGTANVFTGPTYGAFAFDVIAA